MDTYCASGTPPKFRQQQQQHHHHNFSNSGYYHNGPGSRNMRQIGNDYAIPTSNRRSTLSMPSLWQESRVSPKSCMERKSTRGRLCSVALAVASFVVLVVVLGIAGMALYMGALHTEPPPTSNLVTFSCSAKVVRGDRFISALQEKARKYRMQLETLYQRSVLGAALVSCTVEKFGNDTATIFFKLVFSRKKLANRSASSIEKTIRDILITDAISRKPVFRTVRFDPKSIEIKQISDLDFYQRNSGGTQQSKDALKTNKGGVVLKSPFRQNSSLTASSPVRSKMKPPTEEDIKEEDLPVIQGSFKISKTEADITEKKTEVTITPKAKIAEKTTTLSPKNTSVRETYVTSALYKISAVEKSDVSTTTTTPSTTTTNSTTTSTTSVKPTVTTTITSFTTAKSKATSPLFVINPHLFDEEPWIPILPGSQTVPSVPPSTIAPLLVKQNRKQPFYTSFTNPGLSFHSLDLEPLGSTSLKSHPIPVNKIPLVTESSMFKEITSSATEVGTVSSATLTTETPVSENLEQSSGFVEVETVKYVPGSSAPNKSKAEPLLKNLSAIFDDLASTIRKQPVLSLNTTNADEDSIVGQGQVEVVDGDEATLIMQTTKLPLVTLIPVKSNSGIRGPLRKRPYTDEDDNSTNLSVENRSFPGSTRLNDLLSASEENPLKFIETEVVTSISSEVSRVKMDKARLEDFKIVGVLNFATETDELVRNPKMDLVQNKTRNPQRFDMDNGDVVVYATNSSVSSNKKDPLRKNFNVLTPEKLKQLSEISKIHDNITRIEQEPGISKAISSTFTVNHSGFKILTKTFNKINELPKDIKASVHNSNVGFTTVANKTECANFTVKCGDGQCLPEATRCNQLIDCNDQKDEQDCNCADYLRSQFLLRKICDGVVDCWDYSDENQCEWCQPNQYVCGNSKVCIDRNKICDGMRDCPQGDDERQCVTIAQTLKAADEFPYYSEGFLMVRKFGFWGKLCVENFQNVVSRSHISWKISDLGKAVCKSMTYQNLDTIDSVVETDSEATSKYFELTNSFQNRTNSNLSFSDSTCDSKKIVKVKCKSLECGARPQAVKHIARIVGGGNAGLGSWPWQAALYKEGEFQCGATLLSDRWLVSAGHCFYHSQEEHWVARLGALRRGTALPSPYEQLRSIVRIIVHPGYVDSGFINDISLLKMESPVVFSDYVRPICLPLPGQPAIDGRLCTVVGWGQLFEVGRIFPDTLQEVQVPVISTMECRKRTVFLPLYKITDDMFCAGYERGGRDACLGDSGGPLMCPESNGKWVLQGITSNGYGCARANRPGVYTKVANYVPWMHTHMADEDDNTTNSGKSVCLGHRCPLGECLPKSRLCNGYIECSDGSDERDC